MGLSIRSSRWLGLCALIIWCVTSGCLVHAHTPTPDWYRVRTQLLYMGTYSSSPTTVVLGQSIKEIMRAHLPRSQAMAVHGNDPLHVAKLLESNQLFAAVFRVDHARSLYEGSEPFEQLGPVKVRVMTKFDTYALVAHPEMPDRKAYLAARILSRHWDELAVEGFTIPDRPRFTPETSSLPFHPGAADFYRGRPLPPAGHQHVPWLPEQ